ncbi:protein CPR-5 [Phoenix dactylifera]|uniref:Protein CPR-5 n=1 Tax=Phoenix dactylifera TaxID=42345 RepID=A0A8B8ZKE0_PHODC|nr:protein CPR-5 [Phoenix dactylifera]XP_008796098.1 protein CPR-5 [Phoenix dactylifera]XP_038971933.1 protein CPR-5 [Phoenix dactylifera]
MKSGLPILSPCSSAQSRPKTLEDAGAAEGRNALELGGVGDPIAAQPLRRRPPLGKGQGVRVSTSKAKTVPKDAASSSCSPSSSSSSASHRCQSQQRGVHLRRRFRSPWASQGARRGDEEDLQDLALPLGMSFAAVVAKVLDGKTASGERIPVDRLSMICTLAVKESVTNIYGGRFECFIRNFEKSFGSTLKTLRLINETSTIEQGNTSSSFINSSCDSAPTLGIPESPNSIEEFQENPSLNSMNQLVLHGHITQQLAPVSYEVANPGLDQSIQNTFERSIMEQTRSNDLKAVELSLIMKKLQMKQSQLALNSYANLLEKIKISMGISKASFKEEKLRNKIQDMKHAEVLRRCIDLLVTGLIIMSGFLLYGASIYSYQRIAEATSACTSTYKESRSWWIPKPVASFNSGWLMLRCHFVTLTRMSFGVLMILAIAYLLFQRSVMPGPTMPVTFILLLLGVVCGFAGKFCVDTLGGNGYCWLLYWEVFCLLHFFANVFPSAFYHILYGPVSVSQGAKVARLPYWIRRYTFYSILLLILPTLSGLLPFASIHDWKDHFSEKIMLWRLGNESGV